MSHPYYHAKSSAEKWGGTWEDYIPIHEWFDASKAHVGDIRHRMLRHHAQGIFDCQKIFGEVFTVKSTGRLVPTRFIAEQHVSEDFGGKIPSLSSWIEELPIRSWMGAGTTRVSERFEN